MSLKMIHTADWHLGQSFHGFDRDYEHAEFLKWLLTQLCNLQPDVLCIAGDIYDSINPPALAQRRFFSFLADAHARLPNLQIVYIAGNHDAAARLEAPAPLLEAHHVHVVGTVARDATGEIDYHKFLRPLRNASGQVSAIGILVPFLRPADVPSTGDSGDTYLNGIHNLYHKATQCAETLRDEHYPDAALIALGHCHMQNGSESKDSERRIVIGGAEAVREDTFPASLAYVALGHLHKPQSLANGRIRYSGSPLPLSFSEKDYQHTILEVTFQGVSLENVTAIPIPKTVPLLRIPNKAALPTTDLLKLLQDTTFPDAAARECFPFVEIRVLDDGPDTTRRHRIEQALEEKPVRLTAIRLESLPRTDSEQRPSAPGLTTDLSDLDPEDIMSEAHRERFQIDPDPSLLQALREIRQDCSL